MANRLMSEKLRAASVIVCLLAIASIVGDAHAAGIRCFVGAADVTPTSCQSSQAGTCIEPVGSGACAAAGYTVYTGSIYDDYDESMFRCVGNGSGCGAAAVPELEDYAAAAFLVIALTIGRQVRQRRLA